MNVDRRNNLCMAVIAAGGAGSRCQTDIPKQFVNIDKRSILMRTIDVFAFCPEIDGIVVVVSAEWLDYAEKLYFSDEIYNNTSHTPVYFIKGGHNRQESVFLGLLEIQNNIHKDFSGIVVIHDAARPFIEGQCVKEVIEAAEKYGAALSAVPVKDTVKVCCDDAVTNTPDRTALFIAQTPQAFSFSDIMRAHEKAADNCFLATDDCSLVEKLGILPRIVLGCDSNIKITTQHDIAFAQFLLSES